MRFNCAPRSGRLARGCAHRRVGIPPGAFRRLGRAKRTVTRRRSIWPRVCTRVRVRVNSRVGRSWGQPQPRRAGAPRLCPRVRVRVHSRIGAGFRGQGPSLNQIPHGRHERRDSAQQGSDGGEERRGNGHDLTVPDTPGRCAGRLPGRSAAPRARARARLGAPLRRVGAESVGHRPVALALCPNAGSRDVRHVRGPIGERLR